MSRFLLAVHCLMSWLAPIPTDARLTEIADIAADIASTDATATEVELLVSVCKHESGCRLDARGRDGSVGPWQIRGGHDASAAEALRRLRWSQRACHDVRDLGLYAGLGRCDPDAAIVRSLVDPSLPRR